MPFFLTGVSIRLGGAPRPAARARSTASEVLAALRAGTLDRRDKKIGSFVREGAARGARLGPRSRGRVLVFVV